MVRVSVLGIVDIAMVAVAILLGWPVSVHRIDAGFYTTSNSVGVWIDPVLIIETPPLVLQSLLNASGMAVGDVVVLDGQLSDCRCLLQHELTHVIQYRALGEFFPVGALVFNLEGYPYYGLQYACAGLDYMWKPPQWMMWWHMIYLKVPLK